MVDEVKPRQPSDEIGIWIYRHEHEWVEIAANRTPRGVWYPVFRCNHCGDIIEDNLQPIHEE